jgi:cytochrome P450
LPASFANVFLIPTFDSFQATQAHLQTNTLAYSFAREALQFTMLVLDPIAVAIKTLPPWAITLGSIAFATALVAQYTRSSKGKSTVKPRKIHSLGTTIPIFGDMLESLKHVAWHDWISATCQRFKNEPWQINIPGAPKTIVLSDSATIEDVMVAQSDIFVRGPQLQDLLHDLFGDGLVNTDGEQWFHQRKTAAKFFSARTLRLCMMNTMQRNVEQVYEHLDAQCGTGRLADLTDLFQQFTLQTFLEVGVGFDASIIGKSDPSAIKALDEASILIIRRLLLPTAAWKLQRWLNIGRERKLKELVATVHTYVNNLVTQCLSKNNDEAGSGDQSGKIRTAIELFVEHSAGDNSGLRPRDLVDFVLGFLFAARDTSAVTTMWFFYELGLHPEIEAKIREELALKLPQLGVGRDGYITADHVKQLVYLEAVIKETLRFHPAAPITTRIANQDTVIGGDVYIRKGEVMNLSMYGMARNSRLWGPDAAEFKPERWIDTKTGELLSFPATKFFTFGAGPRSCIGMKLAMLNLRVLTANLLHRYKFEIGGENDGSHISALVLAMKHKLLAKVERV